MILTFKTGGRPIKFDIEKTKKQFWDSLKTAKKGIVRVLKTTSGIRRESILGSYTSQPEFVTATYDALQYGKDISLEQVREIRQTLKKLKQLSSKRLITNQLAFEDIITREFIADIEKNVKKKSLRNEIIENIKSLTPKQRVSYYFSKSYQERNSFRGNRYKNIREWAKKDSGNENMSYDEAYDYLIKRRLEDGSALSPEAIEKLKTITKIIGAL